MPKSNNALLAFNRGIVSKSALSRVDVERVRLSAETMENWMPHTQGWMSLRPGLAYLGSSRSDAVANWIEFVAATDDTAMIEITDARVRVWIDDALITRPSVGTTISNSTFASATGWTDASTNGGTLTFGVTGLILNAVNRGGLAVCTRQITVANADKNIEHALAINIARGPVTFRCGSASGGEQYITETTLGTGRHNLSFTPTGNFFLEISSDVQVNRIVTSLTVDTGGVMTLVSPWAEADLGKLRWAQSADVVFVAAEGYKQRRIERRGDGRSWSVIEYDVDNGPFKASTDSTVRLKPSVTFGNGTLTADKKFFKSTHVGQLFRLFHSGNHGVFLLGREDTYTDPMRVTGLRTDDYNDRNFTFTVADGASTWVGGGATLTTQRSFDDEESGFIDFRRQQSSSTIPITANGTYSNTDNDQNSIIFYRLGFKTGGYVAGAASITVSYDGGGDFGICRVTAYNSATSVDMEVLKDFSDVVYTTDWREGLWSDRQGWPTAVALFEGRLWWAGNIYVFGSVSDAYDNFDAETEGDSGPIARSIGAGPVDVVNWLLPLQRLLFGTAGAETSCKSSSFDEPLTPQAFGARDSGTQGSAKLPAAKVDKRGVFVQRSQKRVFELLYASDVLDYESKELTLLCPDITGTATIEGMAVQRQPDTRIHYWLSDGTALIITYEPAEDVLCWSKITTDDGLIEHAVVLPGAEEDRVYYHVNRTINGSTKRYLERIALESGCKGENRNRQLDSYVSLTLSAPVTTISGLDHLIGETVACWGDGSCLEDVNGDIATFVVNGSGQITVDSHSSATAWIIGKQYTALYKSSKLAYAAGLGTALNQMKRAAVVGLILGTAHPKGLEVGGDFTTMDNLPLIKDGVAVATDTVYTEYDEAMRSVPGKWDTDSRLCLRATAPRVCEVLAATVTVATNDKG